MWYGTLTLIVMTGRIKNSINQYVLRLGYRRDINSSGRISIMPVMLYSISMRYKKDAFGQAL